MAPKISVIVPIYNVEPYLEKCLDSLTSQTFKDIEIICIDDGSPDNSATIVKRYVAKDKRISLYQQKNQGLSAARNTGLEHAKAPYIMFCDPDDYYDLTMCAKMYDAIHTHDVDMAHCGIQVEYEAFHELKESDEKYYRIKFNGEQTITPNNFFQFDVSMLNKIFKKSIIDTYDLKFPVGLRYEDACFFFMYVAVAPKTFCIQKKLYHYLRRAASIMGQTFSKSDEKVLDHLNIMAVIYDFLIKNHIVKKFEMLFFAAYLECFYFSHTHLPHNKKHLAIKETQQFLAKFKFSTIECPPYVKEQLHNILIDNYPPRKVVHFQVRLTVAKAVTKRGKYQISVFGIPVFARKKRPNKIIYRILGIPVFKQSY